MNDEAPIHPYIHPFILLCSSKVESQRQQVQERNAYTPLPSHTLPEVSQGVPRPEGIYKPFIESWVCPKASFQLEVCGKPPKGGNWETS